MKRLYDILLHMIRGISKAILRFPLTVLSLVVAAGIICYMISLHQSTPLVVEKLMFTLLVGAFLGMAAQFAVERFEKLAALRIPVYGVSVLLTAGYFLILWPAPVISQEITVRTMVAIFALLCAVLWLPAYKEKADFNLIALINFKSAFTSILYSGVLTAGIAAIISAIDILLFNVNNDSYSYMMTLIWVLFAPVYYLSLLPKFNPSEESEEAGLHAASNFPKFLEILVSYIAIPLVAAYTLVLFAYFIKILVTLHWPSGQLGPMVLIYSAAGLLIFVLSSLLENRSAQLYRKIFPKVLIPVVIMQMISVWIRLDAYGVTESRYYVVLFGVFSIIIGGLLSVRPVTKNSYIALLAAIFAIFSILPPIDAFTISRNSQINRIEGILQSEGILADGKLTPKTNATEESRLEITNILSYLERSSSLRYITWLPEDFIIYEDMKSTFGFEPIYGSYSPEKDRFFYANLDDQQPVVISGYDISINTFSERYPYNNQSYKSYPFKLKGVSYDLYVERLTNQDARVSVRDASGKELIGTAVHDFIKTLEAAEKGNAPKDILPPDKMTLEVSQNPYKMKIVFQSINIAYGTENEPSVSVDFRAHILFGVQ